MSNGLWVLNDYLEEKEEHVSHTFPGQKSIHVIEYSAYGDACAELKLQAKIGSRLTDQNKIMREALKRIVKGIAGGIEDNLYWSEATAKEALAKCGSTEPTAIPEEE